MKGVIGVIEGKPSERLKKLLERKSVVGIFERDRDAVRVREGDRERVHAEAIASPPDAGVASQGLVVVDALAEVVVGEAMVNPDTYLIAGAVAVAILSLLGLLALWHDNAAAKKAARAPKGD